VLCRKKKKKRPPGTVGRERGRLLPKAQEKDNPFKKRRVDAHGEEKKRRGNKGTAVTKVREIRESEKAPGA